MFIEKNRFYGKNRFRGQWCLQCFKIYIKNGWYESEWIVPRHEKQITHIKSKKRFFTRSEVHEKTEK